MNSLHRFNRRSFLKAAAVASAPFLLPSSVWSAVTKPGDKITLGFIGVGIQSRGLMGVDDAASVRARMRAIIGLAKAGGT